MNFNIRIFLLKGVLRRFFLYMFNRAYVQKNIERRKGSCKQCGACCRLFMSHCVYLRFEDGKSSCVNYNGFRMPNCKIFPIDEQDIKERDVLSNIPCGYHF
jgi:hypothetical protein